MNFLVDITKKMKTAQDSMSPEDFMLVAGKLSKLKDQAREKAQSMTTEQLKAIIKKLKLAQELAKDDLNYIRLWIVGDAEGYACMENNFTEWLKEFQRLQEALGEFEKKELVLSDLFKLHGVLEDTLRTAVDIGNFLEKKERIKKFEEAIKDFKTLDREILINILESKLSSSGI